MRPVACILSLACGLLALPAGAQCTGESCFPAGSVPPAVVRVVNAAGRERCFGSGTLVYKDQQQGLILTCAHLFEKAGDVLVFFPDGGRFQAELLATDRLWDLAALRIAPPPAAPISIAAEYPRPGDVVRSCGYGPEGRYRCNQGEVLGYARPALTATYETLELTGSARDGDSGGPVFNGRGELVAVLWGTDGRTVGGTYCGRVRKFLAALLARLRPAAPPEGSPNGTTSPLVPRRPPAAGDSLDRLRQRLEGLGGELQQTQQRLDAQERSLSERMERIAALAAALQDRLQQAEASVGEDNLRGIVREVARGILADHGPGLLETLLPSLLTALGWTGPPSIALILALRLGVGLLRRRVRRKRARASSSSAPRKRQPLNDDYAQQLADVYALSGRSQVADATLGREYDEELRQAEQSSDATLARWARQLRQRVAKRFFRIHSESPSPAEPP